MKCFFIFIMQITTFSIILFAQERITSFDNKITFYVPDETVKVIPRQDFESFEEYKNYYAGNKISINTTIWEANDFLNLTDRQLYQGGYTEGLIDLIKVGKFNQGELLSLLILSNISIAFRASPTIVNDSKAFIEYNNEIVGELYGADGSVDMVAPASYGYIMSLVVDDCIVNISISLWDEDFDLPPKMPEYFEYNYFTFDNYVWLDFSRSRSILYEKLGMSDFEGLPEVFQKLRETLDMVLNTLVIKDYGDNGEAVTGVTVHFPEATPNVEFIPVINNNENNEISGNVIDNFNADIEQTANNADAVVENVVEETGRTHLWLLFLLIIPLSLIIFLILKKRKGK